MGDPAWLLVWFCVSASVPQCINKAEVFGGNGGTFNTEDQCVYWAETMAQLYYDKWKAELAYKCEIGNKHPHGFYVPERR